jgi:hypothetical protein
VLSCCCAEIFAVRLRDCVRLAPLLVMSATRAAPKCSREQNSDARKLVPLARALVPPANQRANTTHTHTHSSQLSQRINRHSSDRTIKHAASDRQRTDSKRRPPNQPDTHSLTPRQLTTNQPPLLVGLTERGRERQRVGESQPRATLNSW